MFAKLHLENPINNILLLYPLFVQFSKKKPILMRQINLIEINQTHNFFNSK